MKSIYIGFQGNLTHSWQDFHPIFSICPCILYMTMYSFKHSIITHGLPVQQSLVQNLAITSSVYSKEQRIRGGRFEIFCTALPTALTCVQLQV